MSLVPSKKLNDKQKIIAKVEFLNFMRRITFCQPSYHVSNRFHFPYSNPPGPSAHTSYIGILPSVTVPSRTHHKVCNDFERQHNQSLQNHYSEFTPSPQYSSTNTAFTSSSSSPFTHMPPSDGNTLSLVTEPELYELHSISCGCISLVKKYGCI